MSELLKGKTILVTGAASGIGRETALHLADLGARLYLNDVNLKDGVCLAETIGSRAEFFGGDVSKSADVERMFKAMRESGHGLDIAINNAGVEHQQSRLADCDEALWDRTIDINLKGVFLCMQQQIRWMLERSGGHIINLASVAGLRSAPLLGPYAASKFGVVGLTRTAAVEYARDGIRVNAVCPGFMRTPMIERAIVHMGEQKAKKLRYASPMGRLGEPLEAANLIAWLCSDESSFVNGQAWALDGGMLS